MSLAEFQRAFADLIASPALTLRARCEPDDVFGSYDLDAREHRRLRAMVRDEGMSVNCTLFRVNRFTPLYSVLPLTCHWIGTRLGPELDAFWDASRDATLQYGPEAERFGAWLDARIAARVVEGGPVEDALAFELAAFHVRTAPTAGDPASEVHPRKRLVAFRHPVDLVLNPPADPHAVASLAEPEWLLLDATSGELEVRRVHDGER
jgi:hypothetical protein